MTNNAYLNGKYLPLSQTTISPMDRGFLFGEAIYEVISYINGKLFQAPAHIERLFNGLKAIDLKHAFETEQLLEIMRTLVANSEVKTGLIYLQITKGCPDKRQHLPISQEAPTIFAYSSEYDFPPYDRRAEGYHAYTHNDLRWARCDIKSTSLLANVMALQSVAQKKSDSYEVILIRDNYLQEGCASAVFIEKNGHIFTPPLTSYILPSITREMIAKCAKKLDIKLIEQNITLEEMYQADNLWVASTTKELSPIIELDGHQIGQGAPSERWHKLIQQLYREYDSD